MGTKASQIEPQSILTCKDMNTLNDLRSKFLQAKAVMRDRRNGCCEEFLRDDVIHFQNNMTLLKRLRVRLHGNMEVRTYERHNSWDLQEMMNFADYKLARYYMYKPK